MFNNANTSPEMIDAKFNSEAIFRMEYDIILKLTTVVVAVQQLAIESMSDLSYSRSRLRYSLGN
jgi:hypothetical protein